jgi:hypothetical protein
MKILTNLKTREIKEGVKIKKTFEVEGETFVVVKEDNGLLQVYHYRTGGGMPSFYNHKGTIKDFTEKGIIAVKQMHDNNPEDFFKILNELETLNN